MIRLAREEDVEAVAKWIWREVPYDAIRARLGPYTFVGEVDDEVVCMYGIRFFLIQAPQVWLLSTPLLMQHRMKFLRANRDFIRWAQSEFGVIESLVKCNNDVSRRWLEWLGFRPIGQTDNLIRMSTHVE